MNSYTLAAESRRWWWPSAAAGVAASAAIAAIALVPASTYASPTELRDDGSAVSDLFADDADQTGYRRPCFMVRPNWNTALDGPQPWCVTRGSDARNSQMPPGTAREVRALRELEVGV